MTADKTGALLGTACGLGALYGGGSPTQVQYLQQAGEHLGMAFQCVDNLLGIWADPGVTGKLVGADVAERRRSLLVVVALNSGTAGGEELNSLYRLDRVLTSREVDRATELIAQAVGRAWARPQVEHHADRAERALHQADLPSGGAAALSTLASTVVDRVR